MQYGWAIAKPKVMFLFRCHNQGPEIVPRHTIIKVHFSLRSPSRTSDMGFNFSTRFDQLLQPMTLFRSKLMRMLCCNV